MEIICPLCNGLKEVSVSCPNCQSPMEDTGPIENYYDDYSPYLDKEITQKLDNEDFMDCVHLFQCSQCGEDQRISIRKEIH